MDNRVGYLYIIKNTVNNYVYIGKTYGQLKARFNQHMSDSKRTNTKFCDAIKIIGKQNFYIELLGIFKSGELEEAEIRTIELFDSYNNGYNSTLGGDTNIQLEFDMETIDDILFLYQECNISIRELSKQFCCSQHTIKNVLMNNNVDLRPQSVSEKTRLLNRKIYGVNSKTGHMVSFDNEYQAAMEIHRTKLSKQDKYFIKNDILRSINSNGTGYGIAGYLWFTDMESAKIKQNNIDGCRYNIIKIDGSILTIPKLIKNKSVGVNNNSKSSNSNNIAGKNVQNNIDKSYPPSKELLSYLIRNHSLNKIADHYGKSFTSIKRLCERMGLPSNKDDIIKYRLTK